MNESFSGTSTVATASGTSWVSVAELLGRQVRVHPSEGVAVVAELCAVLLGRGDQAIPHPADVLLNGEGALTIRGPHHGESDSGALGRLLHDLLDPAHAPVPLRLLASQAISSERYQSVTAFSEALASYEVPGRNKLIQALHKRFVAMPTPPVPSPLRPSLAEPEQTREPAKPDARGRRFPAWAIAPVGIAVVLGGAAAWVSIPSVSLTVPAVIQRALPWLAAGHPSETVAAEPETRPAKPSRAARPRTAAGRVGTDNPVLEPVVDDPTATGVTDTTPATGSVVPLVTTVDVTTLTARIVSDTPALAAAAASAARATSGETPGTLNDVAKGADSVVYSSAFPDVKPPVMVTPQITSPRALSLGPQAASTIELLVDESGRVERVRLVSQPSRILAMMLLSAAKNWQFRPALNDGRPVKYRLLLDVMTTPH